MKDNIMYFPEPEKKNPVRIRPDLEITGEDGKKTYRRLYLYSRSPALYLGVNAR